MYEVTDMKVRDLYLMTLSGSVRRMRREN
jgi:hypothetical protein